jgi:hypothetical protein
MTEHMEPQLHKKMMSIDHQKLQDETVAKKNQTPNGAPLKIRTFHPASAD